MSTHSDKTMQWLIEAWERHRMPADVSTAVAAALRNIGPKGWVVDCITNDLSCQGWMVEHYHSDTGLIVSCDGPSGRPVEFRRGGRTLFFPEGAAVEAWNDLIERRDTESLE